MGSEGFSPGMVSGGEISFQQFGTEKKTVFFARKSIEKKTRFQNTGGGQVPPATALRRPRQQSCQTSKENREETKPGQLRFDINLTYT